MHIIVGVGSVVKKDNKYLLVQESKERVFGLWNLPAGHLDVGETLQAGAIREGKEETNCDIELTGVCRIVSVLKPDSSVVSVIFTARPLTDDIRPQPGEILDVKWFTYEEIIAMRDKLRDQQFVLSAIEAERSDSVMPLDFVATSDHRPKRLS